MSNDVPFDFTESLEKAEYMLGQNMNTEASRKAFEAIGTVLKELYLSEMMRLPFSDRCQVLAEERRYRESKEIVNNVFRMGNWIGLLSQSVFLQKWTETFHVDSTAVQQILLELNQNLSLRNAIFHDGYQPTEAETEQLMSCLRSIEETIAPVIAKHNSLNYNESLENAELIIMKGWFSDAATSCYNVIEKALGEFHIRDSMHLSLQEREALFEIEREFRTRGLKKDDNEKKSEEEKRQIIDREFYLRDWLGLYQSNWKYFYELWVNKFKRDRNALDHIKADFDWKPAMRNEVLKNGHKPSREDTVQLFSFTKRLTETFGLLRPEPDIRLTKDADESIKRYQQTFQPRQLLSMDFVKAVEENTVTYLIGPTGYGKTRLLWEERNRLGKSRGIWIDCHEMTVENQCLDYIVEAIAEFDIRIESSGEALSTFLLDFDGLLILDNFEYCLTSVGQTVSSGYDIAGNYRWLKQFLETAMLRERSPLRIVLLSVVAPYTEITRYKEIDVTQYPLEEEQSVNLLRALDKNNTLPRDRESLQQIAEYCSGIPAALETISTLAHRTDIMDYIHNPDFREMGAEQKLKKLIEELLDKFKDFPEVIVLRALALLGIPFRKGHVNPSADPGIAKLARMLSANIKQKQVNDTLNLLVKTRCIVKHKGEVPEEDEFFLPPLFGRAILQALSSLTSDEQLACYGNLAIFLGNILESFPTQSARDSKVVLAAFYKLQTAREQTIVSRWLWAILKRHDVVELRTSAEIRRSAHAALVAVSSFAAKLHFWWTMYTPLEAYGQILKRVESALQAAEDNSEYTSPKREAFFTFAHRLIQNWIALEQNYPREADWTCAIDPQKVRLVLECITRIRQILQRFAPSTVDDTSTGDTVSAAPAPEQNGTNETEGNLLSDYTYILADYRDVIALLDHLEGEMYRYQGRYEDSIKKQNEAMEAFSDNMDWGRPYLLYSRAEAEFRLGHENKGFQSCFDAIRKASEDIAEADRDVEAIAWAWRDIGIELLAAQRLSSSLKACCLATAYSFRQLPNPSYGGPVYRVDEYNRVFYQHMCNTLVLVMRRAYSIDKNINRNESAAIRELWGKAIVAADQARSKGTGNPIRKGNATPSTLEVSHGSLPSSLENLLEGWQPREESHLVETGHNLIEIYRDISARLNLPRVPDLDLGGYENANDYYQVNTSMWEAIQGSIGDMRRFVEEDLADLLAAEA